MATRVRFADHVDLHVDVPGSLLPLVLPDGLRLQRLKTEGQLELTLRSDRVVSAFVGRLSIPYMTSAGRVEVAHLDIPPPAPWGWGDIRIMRSSFDRLSLPDPTGAGGLRRAEDARRRRASDVAWTALSRCTSAARRVLVRWPSKSETRVVRSPLEQPRGTELIEATERRLGLTISLLRSGERSAPEVTLRRVGHTVPWRNRTLAAVAGRAADALQTAESAGVIGEIPTRLSGPIHGMALRARPELPVPDPPFSSWPPEFVDAYLACLDLLSSVSLGASRLGWVPLTDVWRLYETWLAERMLTIITRLLGQPSWVGGTGEERVAARWTAEEWELDLRHPCVFTNEPRVLVGSEWWSVSSRLDPDVCLLSRTNVGTRCAILDAKDRPRLTAGDIASEASKYQWGIRRGASTTFGVDAVVLVSPFGGDGPYDLQHAQHWAIHAHPNAPNSMPPGEAGTDLSSEFVRRLLMEHLGIPDAAFQS